MFQETNFTGLDLPCDQAALRKSTRAALAVFGRQSSEDRWTLGTLPASLEQRDREEIKEGCYELLLILADAVEQPEAGLQLLDQAAELRGATRYYHVRRADLLARRGDAAGAERERALVSALESSSAFDHFLSGKEQYKRKDWAAALSQFDEVLRIRPDHFWAHCLSAVCALQLSQATRARADLNACLQSEPGFAWLYELRGFASYQVAAVDRLAAEGLKAKGASLRARAQLQLKAAEADFSKALELLSERPNSELQYALLVNRGLLWLERREWSKAIVDLDRAIVLKPAQWQAHEMLAQVYDRQGKPDLAIEQFTQAIAVQPVMAALYRARAAVELGRREQTAGGRERALRDLEMAIRLEPPGSGFLSGDQTNRARLLHRELRENEALSAAEAALAADPEFLDAHRLRIDVLRKLNRHSEAIRSCDVLLARGKPSAELYELRALAKQDVKDYDGAIEDNTLAHAMKPRSAVILTRRGRLFLLSGVSKVCGFADFEEAINLDPSSPASALAYVGRGMARASLGLFREAVVDAARAVRLGKPSDETLYSAARIHGQAAAAAASEVKKTGQAAAALASRYQDQALELLRQTIVALPAAERKSFLRDVVQTDPALAAIRHRLRNLDLAGPALPQESTVAQFED